MPAARADFARAMAVPMVTAVFVMVVMMVIVVMMVVIVREMDMPAAGD